MKSLVLLITFFMFVFTSVGQTDSYQDLQLLKIKNEATITKLNREKAELLIKIGDYEKLRFEMNHEYKKLRDECSLKVGLAKAETAARTQQKMVEIVREMKSPDVRYLERVIPPKINSENERDNLLKYEKRLGAERIIDVGFKFLTLMALCLIGLILIKKL